MAYMGTNSSFAGTSELLDRCSGFVEVFGRVHDKGTLLRITQEVIDEILPNIRCGMYLYNEAAQRLEVVHSKGFSDAEVQYAQETAMERHPGYVFRTGASIYIPDTSVDPQKLSFDSPRSFEVRSRIFCPIIANNKPIGAFGVASTIPNAFTEHDHALFKFVCKLVGATWERIREEDMRKQAETDYQRISLVAMHTSNSVIITDVEGRIVWVNRGFEETTGYTLDEVTGKKPGSFLQGPLTQKADIEAVSQAIRERKELTRNLVNYHKNGSTYDIQLQVFPVFDEVGNLQSYVGLQRDISAEVQSSRIREAHQLRLRQIIEHLPDLLFIIRPEGQVKEYYVSNDTDLYLPREALKDANIYDILPKDLAIALGSIMEQVVGGTAVEPYRYSLPYPEGLRYFEARFALLELEAVMLVIRNITSEIVMEQQRERHHSLV
jgi:PAS domain S-box-containing protein